MDIPRTMDRIRNRPCLFRYKIVDNFPSFISKVLGREVLILLVLMPVSAPGCMMEPKINPSTIAIELMTRKYKMVCHTMRVAFLISDSWHIPYIIAIKIMGRIIVSRMMKKYRLTTPSFILISGA